MVLSDIRSKRRLIYASVLIICLLIITLWLASLPRGHTIDVGVLTDIENFSKKRDRSARIDVYIDNKRVIHNSKPGSYLQIALKPGTYDFRFEADGFSPYEEKVILRKTDSEAYVSCSLQKK